MKFQVNCDFPTPPSTYGDFENCQIDLELIILYFVRVTGDEKYRSLLDYLKLLHKL